MTISFAIGRNRLTMGDSVITNGDSSGTCDEFTGVVTSINEQATTVMRDDGLHGGGEGGSWTILKTSPGYIHLRYTSTCSICGHDLYMTIQKVCFCESCFLALSACTICGNRYIENNRYNGLCPTCNKSKFPVCRNCGNFMKSDDGTTDGYCPSCYDDLVLCDLCKEKSPIDVSYHFEDQGYEDVINISDDLIQLQQDRVLRIGRYICKKCFLRGKNWLGSCIHCGRVYNKEALIALVNHTSSRNDNHVCANCCSRYMRCEKCFKYDDTMELVEYRKENFSAICKPCRAEYMPNIVSINSAREEIEASKDVILKCQHNILLEYCTSLPNTKHGELICSLVGRVRNPLSIYGMGESSKGQIGFTDRVFSDIKKMKEYNIGGDIVINTPIGDLSLGNGLVYIVTKEDTRRLVGFSIKLRRDHEDWTVEFLKQICNIQRR